MNRLPLFSNPLHVLGRHCKNLIFVSLVISVVMLVGCDSGGAGASESSSKPTYKGSSQSSLPMEPQAGNIIISGRVTFDQIPNHPTSGKLMVSESYSAPVRHALLDVIDESGQVLYATQTGNDGEYFALAPEASKVRVRVWAQIVDPVNSQWQAKVVDNTRGNEVYTLISSHLDTTHGDKYVGLHAPRGARDSSGAASAYSTVRASAPFAILETLNDGFAFLSKTAMEPLPELTVAWSVKNTIVDGEISKGEIGSSYFTVRNNRPTIYLLGDLEKDSDDYDRSVILHEFGHYLINTVSRGESPGGPHMPRVPLDLRVAFNEALSNALAALIDQQPLYVDTRGLQQEAFQRFDMDALGRAKGWYSVDALTRFIYDTVDQPAADDDPLGVGWSGLFQVLTSPSFMEFGGAASIYSYLDSYVQAFPDLAPELQVLAERYGLTVFDAYGRGEVDDGGVTSALPIHHDYVMGQSLRVCSSSEVSDFNGIGVHQLIQFSVFERARVTVYIESADAPDSALNPEFVLYRQGQVVTAGFSTEADMEQSTLVLTAGEYTLDLYEKANADLIEGNGVAACFNVTIN